MIVVAMAQHHCIDAPDSVDIWHTAWLGPLPAVKQKPARSRFHHKGGRFLRPQSGDGVESSVHRTDNPSGHPTFRMMKPSRTATATAAPTAGGALACSTRSCGASAALGWMVSTVAAP